MKERIVSGMRSTGKLHLGHYLGVIDNWVKLQEIYESYFFVADWHALTTKYDKTENLKQNYDTAVLELKKMEELITNGIPAKDEPLKIKSDFRLELFSSLLSLCLIDTKLNAHA